MQVNKAALIKPLQSAIGAVERKPSTPILGMVLIEPSGYRTAVIATDLNMQVTSMLDATAPAKPITVAAHKLRDILRSLPDNAEVDLAESGGRLHISAGNSRFSLRTMPAEDFPRMAEASGVTAVLKMTQKQFKRQLALVQYAMAQQDIRYYLNGLLLVAQDRELKLVATDGYRLAVAGEDVDGAGDERIGVILPRKTALELSRQLDDNDELLEIALTPTQARFSFGDVEIASNLIEGKFPDYERVIPQQHGKTIKVDRALFQQSLRRAAILTGEKFRGVRLVLSPGSLKILSCNAENEEAQEEIDVDYAGDGLDVGFNVNYLIDVLDNTGGDAVEMRFADSNSSALITMPGNDRFKYVVMPMRT